MFKIPKKLKTKIFIDGAELDVIKNFNKFSWVSGFTSNPSLMAKAKIRNYSDFILKINSLTNKNKSVSFEVTRDKLSEIEEQALRISKFNPNISVKIPVVNTKGISTINVIKSLVNKKIKLNVTAILTFEQCKKIIDQVSPKNEIILSIFAGRIADTGRNHPLHFQKLIIILKRKRKRNILKLCGLAQERFITYLKLMK